MRIIFVRHGDPNYKDDCLTTLGHLHAEAAAKRLSEEKIDKIYSSSCGRAVETAEHIAAPLGMEIELLDFMREIRWGSMDGAPIFQNGHPWYTADDMVEKGQEVLRKEWAKEDPFSKNRVIHSVQKVQEEWDVFLATLGYEREGAYYRVCRKNEDTILLASHGGSSAAVFAHLFNLTFPFICATIRPDFTAITVVSLEGEVGQLISPTFELLNDSRHIAGIEGTAVYDQ